MNQPFTPIQLYSLWRDFNAKPKSHLKYFLLFICIWQIAGMQASPWKNNGEISPDRMMSDSTIEASICAGNTYFFDGQSLSAPGVYTATYPAADGSDSTVTLVLSVLPISLTSLEASICAGETYEFSGQLLDTSGIYSNTLTAANGCDSIVHLHLTVLEPIHTDLNAAICSGSNYLFQGDKLSESGIYSIVLPASNGCDSIVTLDLKMVPYFETTIKASICPGSTYSFAGENLSVEGVYTDSLTAIGGCDSTIVLHLTIRPSASTNQSASICTGSTYAFNGESLTDSGVYTAHFTAVNGCDSTVVLDLTVVDFYDIQQEATICSGELFYFDGEYLDAEGVYTHSYTAQGGCDSIITFTLHVLPNSTGADSGTICAGEEFEYHGETLSAEGIYTFILESANGCDSTVTFTLNVLQVSSSSVEAVICQGESYAFNGESLADSGTYTAVFSSVNGCDSTVTLQLTVLPVQNTSLNVSICMGEQYDYNGEILTETGTYHFVFSGENGCDSTVTIVLQVNPTQSSQFSASICEGETYEFNGESLSLAGTYTAVFSGVNGCDSTVTLELSLLPLQHTTLEATICANETYAFNGEILSDAGTYSATLTSSNGCDSTVVLTLSVLPTQSTSIAATICEGTAYVYNGIPLSTEGDFDFIFQGENGCDSTVTVSITLLPVAKTTLEATICAGESYDYNGETLTEEGNFDFVFSGANGCDSVVTVQLTVLPLLQSTTEVALCIGSSYVFNGDTLNEAGIYEYVLTGSNGCDSTAILSLEFVPFFETHLQVSICEGESYVFGADTLNASGDYSLLLTAIGGCDSTVYLNLTVHPLSSSTTDLSICEGENYDFNGQILNESGVYTALLTGEYGCDSTAVLNLTVLPRSNTALEATICANESYAFNGENLSDAGIYTAVLTGVNGCDSIIVLTLNVLPVQSSSLSASICANETYEFNGQTLSETGVYTAVLEGSNGCDSILTLELEVLPLAHNAFAATVCNGASFEYNGAVLTESGEYSFTYPGGSVNGCDSVETLFLTIFPAIPPTNLSASICDGESYSFNGQNLSDSGVYTALLSSATGCDSTVTLTLTVNTVNTNVILQGGTITTQATNATYQWINCANNQIISGATESYYTPTATGNYAVVITQDGCTATSTCVYVLVVGTNEPINALSWDLQPNPTAAQSALVFTKPNSEDLSLKIFDLTGRMIHNQMVTTGTIQVTIDLSEFPDGLFLVRLATEHHISTKRLIKGHR